MFALLVKYVIFMFPIAKVPLERLMPALEPLKPFLKLLKLFHLNFMRKWLLVVSFGAK